MEEAEWRTAGTPWMLIAIYVVLAGVALSTSYSPLVELTFALSLLPAGVGAYLTVQEYVPAAEE